MNLTYTNDRGEQITEAGHEGSPLWIRRKYPDILDYARHLYQSAQFPKHPIAIWFFYLELEQRQIPRQHWRMIFLISPFGDHVPDSPQNTSPRELLGYLDQQESNPKRQI